MVFYTYNMAAGTAIYTPYAGLDTEVIRGTQQRLNMMMSYVVCHTS